MVNDVIGKEIVLRKSLVAQEIFVEYRLAKARRHKETRPARNGSRVPAHTLVRDQGSISSRLNGYILSANQLPTGNGNLFYV
jgi:hypothetical protein